MLGVTPGVPDSPYNFLSIPAGNGNFRTLGVDAGDIVRYFVKYNQDDLEHGFENVTYLELLVRRRDSTNPQNALILEYGLNGSVEIPHRVEVWRFSDRRMRDIQSKINRYWKQPKEFLGWEPSPDESALVQLTDRLNQWWRNLPPSENDWQPDKLVGTLPQELSSQDALKPILTDKSLTGSGYELWETRLLQEAVWLRDISTWAKKSALSDLEVAQELFDWTVRNVQLDAPGGDSYIHLPWQALIYGHGSAADRTRIFAELCRHQQLDVVMLGIRNPSQPTRWWLPALVSGGELHLFDPQLGLAIPGEDPNRIATLSDVRKNPALLDKLSLEGESPYPVTSEMLSDEGESQIVAGLISSHLQLSRRASELQQVLESENFITLSADLATLRNDVEQLSGVDEVLLWPQPFETIVEAHAVDESARRRAAQRFLIFAQRPKLWKARILHFQGTKDIPLDERNDPLAQADQGHRRATALYQDRGVRPSARLLSTLDRSKQAIYGVSKVNAGYWLGLLKADEGRPEVAKHWLEVQTLEASPNSPWTSGARYNLARCYEELGELEKAIELLEQGDPPQRLGNLLRARMLKAQRGGNNDAANSDQNE